MKETAPQRLKRWRVKPIEFVRECFKVEPDPWQAEVLNNFYKNNRIGMKACKGPGKLETCSHKLYTPQGLRRWGDLLPGDYVFAEDGSPTRIKNVYPQGVKDIYTITFDDGSEAQCGLDHLWKVRGRFEKRKKIWAVIDTKEIIRRGVKIFQGEREYYQFQIPLQGAAEFPKKNLVADPYVIGVWLGDGTRSSGNYTKNDVELAVEIRRRGINVTEQKTAEDKCKLWKIENLTHNLKEINLFGCRSYEKYIPEEYKVSGVQQRKDLLAGLMDTDGTIDKDDGHMEYDTTSKQLAEDVVWLVRSLGGKSWIKNTIKKAWYRDKDGKKIHCRDCYRVSVTLPFNPFILERKSKRWHKPTQDRYLMRTITSIKKTSKEDAMCIEVEHESHCYLTNDFIVTHNTCLIAWLIWNFLATRPHPKMAATSITSDNLSDNLWPELAKWQNKSNFLKETFVWTKTRVFSKNHPQTWFLSARTWSKSADKSQQADTLAGLHAEYLMFVLDEVGGIPDSVMASAEAGLATGTETKILMAGNPTHTEGPLYRACTSQKHLWYVVEITGDPDDPMRSPRISKEWALQQIENYGKDNPWVLVNVFGKFPPSSLNTLLGPEEVREAMKRHLTDDMYDWAQKRLGVDVSRFGDDLTCIFPRQGLASFKPVEMRHIRDSAVSVDIATRVMMAKQQWGSNWEAFDDTVGWAHGAIDVMRAAGHSPLPVAFGSPAFNPRYKNRRAEMWFAMAEWIKKGGALPNIPELVGELTTPIYHFDGGKFQIEEKKQIKERLGRSPDRADSLALTFCVPEASKIESFQQGLPGSRTNQTEHEYNPYADDRI